MLKIVLANLPANVRACFLYAAKTGTPYKYVVQDGMLLVNVQTLPANYKIVEQTGAWTYAKRSSS